MVNFYQTTWCNKPEDSHLHGYCCENLKSHLSWSQWLCELLCWCSGAASLKLSCCQTVSGGPGWLGVLSLLSVPDGKARCLSSAPNVFLCCATGLIDVNGPTFAWGLVDSRNSAVHSIHMHNMLHISIQKHCHLVWDKLWSFKHHLYMSYQLWVIGHHNLYILQLSIEN
jgi:hypothetical protein